MWQQIINFYKRQGFYPTAELDTKYIVPLLEQLNDKNLAVTDENEKIYNAYAKIYKIDRAYKNNWEIILGRSGTSHVDGY